MSSNTSEFIKNPYKKMKNDFKNYNKVDYNLYCSNPNIERIFLESAMVSQILKIIKK